MNKTNSFEHKRKIKKKTKNRGFTLIELMVALTILSMGLLAIAKMQIFGIQSNTHGNMVTIATILAQDRLEQIKDVISSGQTVNLSDFPQEDFGDIPNFSRFSRQVTISNGTDFNTITVTTSWRYFGIGRRVSVSTIY